MNLRRFLNSRFLKTAFFKNVLTLMLGTGLAQLITLCVSPVLTRLYIPEDFGGLSLFTALVAIFGVVANGRMELAIPLPSDFTASKNIFRLALIITLGFSAALCLLMFLTYGTLINTPYAFSKWFLLIPLSVVFFGIQNAINYWLTRNTKFKLQSQSKIILSLVSALTSVGLGFAGMGTSGLLLGFLFGQFTCLLWIAVSGEFSRALLFKDFSWNEIKTQAKEYRSFYKINTPHALIDAIQENGIVYLIAVFFTKSVTGLYSFAFKILKAPLSLLGGAFFQAFYNKIAEAKHQQKEISSYLRAAYGYFFIIGFPVFIVLFLYAPELFGFVFGASWRESGHMAQILAPWLFLNFIVSSVSSITLVCEKQKEAFIITGIDVLLRLMALAMGCFYESYRVAFLWMSINGSLLMLFTLWWYDRIARLNNKDINAS